MYALLVQPTEAQTTRVTNTLYFSMSGKRLPLVAAGDLLHFISWDGYVMKVFFFGGGGLHFLQILSVWQNWYDF